MTGADAIQVIARELRVHEQMLQTLTANPSPYRQELVAREHVIIQTIGDLLERLRSYEQGESPALVDAAAAILRGETIDE